MDADGTLYLYRTSSLCANDIIKRLTEGRYKMAESNMLLGYTLFFCKNVVFPAQAEYSYFSADFRLKIFLYYS